MKSFFKVNFSFSSASLEIYERHCSVSELIDVEEQKMLYFQSFLAG
jgi:hypothetical protein